MLSVVTYWWQPDGSGKFSVYGPNDVRLLQRMVARHLHLPHQFICITDQPEVFADDADIRTVRIDWTTHVPGTCYVRLFTLSPEARKILGERVLQLDLDIIVVGDMTPIVTRDEDLVLWRNPRKWALTYPEVGHAKALSWFNGALMLHSPGTWGVVWQNFDPTKPGARDDQWLISDYVGKDNPYWDQSHGIYRFAGPHKPWQGMSGGVLPDDARIIMFAGSSNKPWLEKTRAENPWIVEHWR